MDIRSAFQSQYLAAYDLPADRPVTITIEAVEVVEVEQETGGTKGRPAIRAAKARKLWLLNKTNSELLAAMWGYETEAWIGKRVSIAREKVRFGRETVDGIRVQGSPDLDHDLKATVKLPRKRPREVVLTKTLASE